MYEFIWIELNWILSNLKIFWIRIGKTIGYEILSVVGGYRYRIDVRILRLKIETRKWEKRCIFHIHVNISYVCVYVWVGGGNIYFNKNRKFQEKLQHEVDLYAKKYAVDYQNMLIGREMVKIL